MKKLLVSYCSDDAADADDLAQHLENVFQDADIKVCMASKPESITPGNLRQHKTIDALSKSDTLLALMTINALASPQINLEIGIAWARKARTLIFCANGITPAALPSPYNTLQVVDLNGMLHEAKLNRVTDAVARSLNIKPSQPPLLQADISPSGKSVEATISAWNRRPAAHIEATADGEFLVGSIGQANVSRAGAAGFKPGEALSVRLYFGKSREIRYINAMASGAVASFFEAAHRDSVIVRATIKLAAVIQERNTAIPLLVVDTAKVCIASKPESITLGNLRQHKTIDALSQTDTLLALMTVNALASPQMNLEIGIAWARKARTLILCAKGITPAAFPSPYNTLQVVDLNGMLHEAKLNQVTNTVARALNIKPSHPPLLQTDISPSGKSAEATISAWNRRPAAYIEATAEGEFLVGNITQANVSRAGAAGFQPGEALSVRLYFGKSRESRYINAMAIGAAASFFEAVTRDSVIVRATIKLAAVIQERNTAIPILVVDTVEEVT